MEPLIFIRRGKASATSEYTWQIKKYCQKNGVKEWDISHRIMDETSDISVRMYGCALELRRANIWTLTSPCVVWGYPGPNQSHLGYQEKAWSRLGTQLLDWSSTRYQAQFIEPGFPDNEVDIEDALDDLLHQSALLRRDLRLWTTPGVDETIHNLAGGQDREVALVGDVHNHEVGRLFPQPFLAMKNSSGFLHKAMAKLPNGLPWCFNSGDTHADIVLNWLQASGVKGFVALGNKAENFLNERAVPNVKIYHPSYAKRFNVGLDEYTNSLLEAVIKVGTF